jgi:HD-like signal output (HDOD) protein
MATTIEVDATRILAAASQVGFLGAGRAALPALLARLCDPLSSADEIALLLQQEPGVAARVLRVANSAYYAASGSVATLERAFVVLGVDAIRGIAAAACLDRDANRILHSSHVDANAMLRHWLATAVAAEALARQGLRRHAAEAFIAGLLHDFGVILQLQLDLDVFERLVTAVNANPATPVRQQEIAAGCVSHERCAAVCFAAWKLPANLVDAIGHHHDPASAPATARPIAQIVYVANRLAIANGYGYLIETLPAPLDEAMLAAIGINQERYDVVADTLDARCRPLLAALGGHDA